MSRQQASASWSFKKTEKTPRREIETALKRAKEVK
jgi:phage-related protein